ncbi:hypothetical protein MKW94_029856 [Papaver nudicaule]|uniref:Uncharacterized protein n=1 Tax=Papaver nudicaule TaxID=74823 RepID=A0AA41RNT4_PAPNU|nr:hypothetical protein [Papaver nudicaule]
MSPRSGTPVKLLGRDDASVDWYNLEKSRRVKAFRCGEFDDCIEKAASFQGKTPIKKREKYARREDAIRHALELEMEQLEKKPRLRSGVNSLRSKKLKNGVGTPDNPANGQSKSTNLKSLITSKKLDSSGQVKSMGNSIYALNSKPGKQPISKGKTPLPVDHHVKVEVPTGVPSFGGECLASSSEKLLDMKRKRALVEPSEESPAKKRDRRRCLAKVLRNSAKIVTSLQDNGESVSISAQGEKVQTGDLSRLKRIRCVNLPAELNNGMEHTDYPGDNIPSLKSQFKTDGCDVDPSSSTEENSSSGSLEDESSDTADSEYVDQDMEEITPMDSIAAGRINSGRYITGNSEGIIQDTFLERKPIQYHKSEELGNASLGGNLIKNWEYGRKKHQSKLEAAQNDRGRNRRNFFDSEGTCLVDGLSQVLSRRYWDGSSEWFPPGYGSHSLNDRRKSLLVDVDIKVQSGYHGEHVPLVSMMSRLNGKAIVGHPVPTEVLEDDSMDLLLTNEDLRDATIDGNGGMLPVPPAWRTARRTVMLRVRRPNTSSSAALDGDQAEASNQSLYRPPDLESKLSVYKKLYSSRKGISKVHSSKKTPTDPLKKVTLSSQKTRMLSSIAGERKHSGQAMSDQKLLIKGRRAVGGLLRLDEIGPTVVTCIPVKLVFSRLMETVGRPPSSRTGRRSFMPSINGVENRKEKSIGTKFAVKED